jgi:hypothetical protein
MSSDGLCSDPVDFSLLILKILAKCCKGSLSFLFYALRAALGLLIDGIEIMLLSFVLGKKIEDNKDLGTSLEIALGFLVSFGFIAISILIGYVLIGIFSDESDYQVQKRKNRFFLGFKIINLIFAAVIGAGTIYGKDEIDLSNRGHILLIVSLGLDAVFDPIELVVGSIMMCRS